MKYITAAILTLFISSICSAEIVLKEISADNLMRLTPASININNDGKCFYTLPTYQTASDSLGGGGGGGPHAHTFKLVAIDDLSENELYGYVSLLKSDSLGGGGGGGPHTRTFKFVAIDDLSENELYGYVSLLKSDSLGGGGGGGPHSHTFKLVAIDSSSEEGEPFSPYQLDEALSNSIICTPFSQHL